MEPMELPAEYTKDLLQGSKWEGTYMTYIKECGDRFESRLRNGEFKRETLTNHNEKINLDADIARLEAFLSSEFFKKIINE